MKKINDEGFAIGHDEEFVSSYFKLSMPNEETYYQPNNSNKKNGQRMNKGINNADDSHYTPQQQWYSHLYALGIHRRFRVGQHFPPIN